MDLPEFGDHTKRKLHLGCGRTILDGWVNLDSIQLKGVDVVADLDDCENRRLPFEDNYFDEFLASHLIEHLHNPLPFMQELHRISKNNAKLILRLPYGASDAAFEDPTHVRQYFLNSFGYFSQPYYWRADYGYRGDWQVVIISLLVEKNRYAGKKPEEIFFEINTFRNVVREMIVELKSIKPVRAPIKELQAAPKIDIRLI
jgi:SAM-dependent methyltransferase